MTILSVVYHSLHERTHRQAEAIITGLRQVPGHGACAAHSALADRPRWALARR